MKAFLFPLFFSLISFITTAQDSPSQINQVDFKKAQVELYLNQNSNIISGKVTYQVEILKDCTSLFIDAKNLTRYEVKLDDKFIDATYNETQLVLELRFRESATHKITVEFSTQPNKALYHIDRDNDGAWDQIWTQGQGKYTSNWLPSIDDVNDKMEWDITINAPQKYTAISNGLLQDVEQIEDRKIWRYDMKQPMSSYLVALVVGHYEHIELQSQSGIVLQQFYYPNDKHKVDYTYKHSQQMFDFLEQEIGVYFPWQVYKQVPVKDFLYSGMENTSLTVFNDQFMVDELAFNDGNYVTVNAHELAHQWFGNLITATSSEHHWLQEGFATYYSMLAERDIHGDDHYYMTLYENAEALIKQTKSGHGTALLDPKSSSLTFYQHGAWALHALRDLVGDNLFKTAIRNYLKQYAYKNVTTDDFLNIISETSGKDLTVFKNRWLTNTQFPAAEALKLLRENDFMEQYFQLAARRTATFDEAYHSYKETLENPNPFLVEEMISQLTIHDDSRKIELYKKAAVTGDARIRQAIALSLQEYLPELDSELNAMLYDDSYLTRESALFLLWNGKPMDRSLLLREVEEKWESMNPSLEMAWLVLALNTNNFSDKEKLEFLNRLGSFTSSIHSTQTRTAAFDYLTALNAMSRQNYHDLIESCLHHSWRYYKNSRDLLKALYKKEYSKPVIDQIIMSLSERDKLLIKKVLE